MCVQQNPSNKETIGTTHGVQVSVFQGFLFKFLVDMVMGNAYLHDMATFLQLELWLAVCL